jgi:hypothetical protein
MAKNNRRWHVSASTQRLACLTAALCALTFFTMVGLYPSSSGTRAGLLLANAWQANDRRRKIASARDEACAYFFSGQKFDKRECNISQAVRYSAAAALAGGCVPKMAINADCRPPSVLLTHTWVHTINLNDTGLMQRISLMLRAWMMTQDLDRSHLIFWHSDWLPKTNDSATPLPIWLEQFKPHVEFRRFDYSEMIQSTPLTLSRHFDVWERFENITKHARALQSDVFRHLILYKYGGLWLDSDAVPLRDMWNITVGVGLQFVPRFTGWISNGHVLYVRCHRSSLARRRLETITAFPYDHPKSWPRHPPSGAAIWVFNDGISEHVRASQALAYSVSRSAESFDPVRVADLDWEDLEVSFPIGWFDPWWVCPALTKRNNTDFLNTVACDGTFIWHHLTSYYKDRHTFGNYSGAKQFWDEIFEGQRHDHTFVKHSWPVEPRVLRGGVDCQGNMSVSM